MDLPIEVIAGTHPPQFRWQQSIDTIAGKNVVDQYGYLPVGVDTAVEQLVKMAHQLILDNACLRGEVQTLREHNLPKSATPSAQQPITPKRGGK